MRMDDQTAPLRLVPPDKGRNAATRRAMTRRTFVGASLAAAGAVGTAGVSGLLGPTSAAAATNPPSADPFRLGIASGDPTATGVVLWTRLAVDPLAEDGRGGMPNHPITVQWQLATDEAFHHVRRAGDTVARPELGHSVHLEVEGLAPDREYFYRFRVGSHVSPPGRTRTMPARGTSPALSLVALCCSHYEGGYFTAYDHAARERPDLVLELGDYIYEGAGVPGRIRVHPGPTCTTLADYRRRYALYKNEPETRALHAVAPWIVTWDDHEVQDNWAGIYPKDGVPSDAFDARRAAAAQAYYEFMPLRSTSVPNGPDIKLYRRFAWGDLADLQVLDTREFRSKQACNNGQNVWWFSDCDERYDPSRTMLGADQTAWVLDGFARSTARWELLAQGDFFCQRDITAGEVTTLATDGWDGYVPNRDRIRDGWVERGIENAVVLSGDVHMHFANEVKANFSDPDSATVGVELLATSVTSGGDGSDDVNGGPTVLAENPWIKYIANRRGYISVDLTTERLRADFKIMPYVSSRGAPLTVGQSYVVEAGNPALQAV